MQDLLVLGKRLVDRRWNRAKSKRRNNERIKRKNCEQPCRHLWKPFHMTSYYCVETLFVFKILDVRELVIGEFFVGCESCFVAAYATTGNARTSKLSYFVRLRLEYFKSQGP